MVIDFIKGGLTGFDVSIMPKSWLWLWLLKVFILNWNRLLAETKWFRIMLGILKTSYDNLTIIIYVGVPYPKSDHRILSKSFELNKLLH
jgi:hypothetical protein